MAVGDAYVFPGFLTPVLTQLFFPKPPTTFLTCFYASAEVTGKNSPERKVPSTGDRLSQPPGHESDMLTTEPPGRGSVRKGGNSGNQHFEIISPFPTMIFILSKRENIILATFNLSSAHTFYLIMSKILSFGNDLTALSLKQYRKQRYG